MLLADMLLIGIAGILLLGNLVLRIVGEKKQQFAYNVALLIALAGAVLFETLGTSVHYILGALILTPFSDFFMLIFAVGMILVNLLAFTYSENYGDFAILSNFALAGMYLISLSASLLTIFIGLELASLPVVFIILLSKRSIEAATKFFIMTSIAVALLSFAIVLFYGGTGSLLLNQAVKTPLLLFSAILFIVSLGIDSSLFPFNLLIPDVYEGSPAYATSLLGGLSKKAGFAALIQVVILLFFTFRSAFDFIIILAVATMFYGNLAAIMQTNLKRMLAYSSISQAGYILIGLAVGTPAGITGSLFQIFSHMFAFIGLLGIVAWLESKNRTRIEDLAGLSSENRFVAFSMALLMLALAGLPLTAGFIGKFLIFLSAVNSGLIWLAIVGIINSVISVFYYSRPIISAYTNKEGTKPISVKKPVYVAIAATLVITVAFGIYPQPIISMATHAASYLFSVNQIV